MVGRRPARPGSGGGLDGSVAPAVVAAPSSLLRAPYTRPASASAAHGLDDEFSVAPGEDVFTSAFEASAQKMRELDLQNAALQRQARDVRHATRGPRRPHRPQARRRAPCGAEPCPEPLLTVPAAAAAATQDAAASRGCMRQQQQQQPRGLAAPMTAWRWKPAGARSSRRRRSRSPAAAPAANPTSPATKRDGAGSRGRAGDRPRRCAAAVDDGRRPSRLLRSGARIGGGPRRGVAAEAQEGGGGRAAQAAAKARAWTRRTKARAEAKAKADAEAKAKAEAEAKAKADAAAKAKADAAAAQEEAAREEKRRALAAQVAQEKEDEERRAQAEIASLPAEPRRARSAQERPGTRPRASQEAEEALKARAQSGCGRGARGNHRRGARGGGGEARLGSRRRRSRASRLRWPSQTHSRSSAIARATTTTADGVRPAERRAGDRGGARHADAGGWVWGEVARLGVHDDADAAALMRRGLWREPGLDLGAPLWNVARVALDGHLRPHDLHGGVLLPSEIGVVSWKVTSTPACSRRSTSVPRPGPCWLVELDRRSPGAMKT